MVENSLNNLRGIYFCTYLGDKISTEVSLNYKKESQMRKVIDVRNMHDAIHSSI